MRALRRLCVQFNDQQAKRRTYNNFRRSGFFAIWLRKELPDLEMNNKHNSDFKKISTTKQLQLPKAVGSKTNYCHFG